MDTAHVGPYADSPKPVLFLHRKHIRSSTLFTYVGACGRVDGGREKRKILPYRSGDMVGGVCRQRLEGVVRCRNKGAEEAVAGVSADGHRCDNADRPGQVLRRTLPQRCAVRLYEKTKDRRALERSIALYKNSRATWAALAEKANGIYMADVTVGEQLYQRGHWLDRLPAMDTDIAQIETMLTEARPGTDAAVSTAVAAALGKSIRLPLRARHTLPLPSILERHWRSR